MHPAQSMCLRLLLVLLLSSFAFSARSQSLKGFLYDSDNNPIPYVNVHLRQTDQGTATDMDGKYYLDLEPGYYKVMYSAVGYKSKTVEVVIDRKDVVKNIWLETNTEQLDELVVKAKRRDPAYEIIRNAIKSKSRFQNQLAASSCDVYIKAVEQKDESEKAKAKREAREQKEKDKEELEDENSLDAKADTDPFAEEKKARQKLLNSMNMTEVRLTRHYQAPNKVKEIRTGFQKYGSKRGLYYLSTVREEIDFYNSLLFLNDLTETPIISPLHITSVVNYKFKLEETFMEGDELVYRIRVTPRKKGANATVEGHLWITDGIWNIRKLDLTLKKGNMIIYDEFRVEQEFTRMADTLWIMTFQQFHYETKSKDIDFRGKTTVNYSNFDLNPTFPKRFFSNEVGVTTKEAYERDSSYWDEIRPAPLTLQEQKYVAAKDSLDAVLNSKEYLDSVDADYNRVTPWKVLYWGVGHRNRAKKQQWYFGSILDYWEPFSVGGMRFGPYGSFFKKTEDERWVWANIDSDVGFLNGDLKGNGRVTYNYDPMHQGRIQVFGGHTFGMINTFDAYLNMLLRSNYITRTFIGIDHRYELINGLYVRLNARQSDRKPLPDDMRFGRLMDVFDNNNPIDFESYQAFRTYFALDFTPFQKFIREPYHKEVIGSKWPTFSLVYEKGWEGPFGSDINFDYLGVEITQRLKVGTFGTSRYNLMSGKFINTKDLRYIDYKFFRQSDPWLYSNPLFSFQVMDTSISTTKLYVEGHYIHHFNGAIINNIPLVKKTRIKLVAGAGGLWVQDGDFQYAEAFGGIERVFRIVRTRFRLGAYGVIGKSNYFPLNTGIKFSIEFYNRREGKWNF